MKVSQVSRNTIFKKLKWSCNNHITLKIVTVIRNRQYLKRNRQKFCKKTTGKIYFDVIDLGRRQRANKRVHEDMPMSKIGLQKNWLLNPNFQNSTFGNPILRNPYSRNSIFRNSVFRNSFFFEIRFFEIRSSKFGFSKIIFFKTRFFVTRFFKIRLFQIRFFQIRLLQIRLLGFPIWHPKMRKILKISSPNL